jgi:hypothetical protein
VIFKTDNTNIIEQIEKKKLKELRKLFGSHKIYNQNMEDLEDWELVLLKNDMGFAALTQLGEVNPELAKDLAPQIAKSYKDRYTFLCERLNLYLHDSTIEKMEESGDYSLMKNMDSIDYLLERLSVLVTNTAKTLSLREYPISLN